MPAATSSAPRQRRAAAATAPAPLPNKHARNRSVILAAAAQLFFERGYSGTTVDEIAGRLAMTKPYVYYYFSGGKAEIYAALCLEAADATLSSLDFPRPGEAPVLDVLREGFRRLALANMAHFEASSLYYREPQALESAVRKRILARARDFYRAVRGLIEQGQRDGTLAKGIDPAVAALSVSSVIGFMYRWYDPNGPFTRERMAEELSATMLRIAGAPTLPAPVASTRRKGAPVV
ncbi:MAG TPA: TetR/AcrR family transcriptional regulator [Ramlibacter sp.]|nr:TetR/AcrR family transcriptional regulator [Ramlibacter sp.]